MATWNPVVSMRCLATSGSGGEDVPEFFCCVDGQHPKIFEVWTFGEDGVTREVHPIARVDVGAGFVGKFATNYLNTTWHRLPMFRRNDINGSVKWLGVPYYPSNDGPMPFDFSSSVQQICNKVPSTRNYFNSLSYLE